MLLVRVMNVPGVFVVNRVTTPGGGFVRVNVPVTVRITYLNGRREERTISGDFIPPAPIARIDIQRQNKQSYLP